MKIVNFLAILLVGILLYALNDAALAETTSKKIKSPHHYNHPSRTSTSHHPSPTEPHHHHHPSPTKSRKHHRNHPTHDNQHKTRTRTRTRTRSRTLTSAHATPNPRIRSTSHAIFSSSISTSVSIQPIVPNYLPNNSILDPIPTATYHSPDSGFTANVPAPTNELAPNVSDPNDVNPVPATTGITPQSIQNLNSIQTKSVDSGSSNGSFALAVGISIGGVAALGLAGYAVHRRREASRDGNNNETPPQVNTRWRHQSFLAKVESIVARLPSDSRSSRSSRKSKKSSLSGSTSTLSPAVDHSTIPVASTSQADYEGGNMPEYMEEVHLR